MLNFKEEESPVLVSLDPHIPYMIANEKCAYELGAGLSQEQNWSNLNEWATIGY